MDVEPQENLGRLALFGEFEKSFIKCISEEEMYQWCYVNVRFVTSSLCVSLLYDLSIFNASLLM